MFEPFDKRSAVHTSPGSANLVSIYKPAAFACLAVNTPALVTLIKLSLEEICML